MKKLEKTIEYLIYLFLFLLPLQTRWIIRGGMLNGGYSEYGAISLYGIDILIFAIFILILIGKKFQISNFKFQILESARGGRKLLIAMAVFDLVAFISIFFAGDVWLAVYKYLFLLICIGIFFVLRIIKIERIKLIYAFLAGIFLQAVLAIWQFVTQNAFACKWLGLSAHNPLTPGTSVVETILGDRILRAYGGLDHPNMLGGFVVMGIVLVVWLILEKKFNNNRPHPPVNTEQANPSLSGSRLVSHPLPTSLHSTIAQDRLSGRGRRKRGIYFALSFIRHALSLPNGRGVGEVFNRNWKLFFYFFIFSIFFLALIFSFSRTAWVVCAFALITYLVYALAQKNEWMVWRIVSVILVSWTLALAVFSANSLLFITRLEGGTRLEDKSISERSIYMNDARELISNNWLTGVGIGNYSTALAKAHPERNVWSLQPVHNAFILILSEIGIVGLISIVALLYCYIVILFRNKNNNFTFPGVLIIVSLIILMFADHWLWSLHFGVLMFWIVLGLAFARKT